VVAGQQQGEQTWDAQIRRKSGRPSRKVYLHLGLAGLTKATGDQMFHLINSKL